MAQAIAGLLAGGCIFEHSASRFCVTPLTVAGGWAEVAFIHRSQSRNQLPCQAHILTGFGPCFNPIWPLFRSDSDLVLTGIGLNIRVARL